MEFESGGGDIHGVDSMSDSAGNSAGEMKLFVGQVPKTMDEDGLRCVFEEFGRITYLTVIRDRVTKAHRGCAFVTYATPEEATSAIFSLHDKVKLPNIRPAEYPSERENKVFVGMLNKSLSEPDLEMMFAPYGELKEIHVVRDNGGYSKGCAFVKFVDRNAAIMAINELNESIPKGSSRPLVIKFADNKKANKWKKSSGDIDSSNQYWSEGSGSGYGYPQAMHMMPAPPGGRGGRAAMQQGMVMGAPYGMPYGQQQQVLQARTTSGPQGGYYFMPGSPAHQQAYFNAMGGVNFGVSPGGASGGERQPQRPQRQTNRNPAINNFGYESGSGISGNIRGGSDVTVPVTSTVPKEIVSATGEVVGEDVNARPPEGPAGANLFIYHLPRDLTDADLATLFAAFGNVVSAKVFVDKKTTESKGFGFVSYDNVNSAEAAIGAMNGFQIGSKRLKVQHKRTGHSSMGMMGEFGDGADLSFSGEDVYQESTEHPLDTMESFLTNQLPRYREAEGDQTSLV